MAASVPTWQATSKGRPNCSASQPKKALARIRWAELDTGRNSVSPWTMPSSAAWRSSTARACLAYDTRTLRPPLRGRSTASSTGTAARGLPAAEDDGDGRRDEHRGVRAADDPDDHREGEPAQHFTAEEIQRDD